MSPTSYGSRLVEPTWWFILIAKSNTEQMKTIEGELIKGTACLPAGYLEVWTTLHCEFSLETGICGHRPKAKELLELLLFSICIISSFKGILAKIILLCWYSNRGPHVYAFSTLSTELKQDKLTVWKIIYST